MKYYLYLNEEFIAYLSEEEDREPIVLATIDNDQTEDELNDILIVVQNAIDYTLAQLGRKMENNDITIKTSKKFWN